MSVRAIPASGKKPIFDRISIFEQKQQAQSNPPPPRGQNLVTKKTVSANKNFSAIKSQFDAGKTPILPTEEEEELNKSSTAPLASLDNARPAPAAPVSTSRKNSSVAATAAARKNSSESTPASSTSPPSAKSSVSSVTSTATKTAPRVSKAPAATLTTRNPTPGKASKPAPTGTKAAVPSTSKSSTGAITETAAPAAARAAPKAAATATPAPAKAPLKSVAPSSSPANKLQRTPSVQHSIRPAPANKLTASKTAPIVPSPAVLRKVPPPTVTKAVATKAPQPQVLLKPTPVITKNKPAPAGAQPLKSALKKTPPPVQKEVEVPEVIEKVIEEKVIPVEAKAVAVPATAPVAEKPKKTSISVEPRKKSFPAQKENPSSKKVSLVETPVPALVEKPAETEPKTKKISASGFRPTAETKGTKKNSVSSVKDQPQPALKKASIVKKNSLTRCTTAEVASTKKESTKTQSAVAAAASFNGKKEELSSHQALDDIKKAAEIVPEFSYEEEKIEFVSQTSTDESVFSEQAPFEESKIEEIASAFEDHSDNESDSESEHTPQTSISLESVGTAETSSKASVALLINLNERPDHLPVADLGQTSLPDNFLGRNFVAETCLNVSAVDIEELSGETESIYPLESRLSEKSYSVASSAEDISDRRRQQSVSSEFDSDVSILSDDQSVASRKETIYPVLPSVTITSDEPIQTGPIIIIEKDTDICDNQPTNIYDHQPADIYDNQPTDIYNNQPTDTYGNQPTDTYGNQDRDVYDNKPLKKSTEDLNQRNMSESVDQAASVQGNNTYWTNQALQNDNSQKINEAIKLDLDYLEDKVDNDVSKISTIGSSLSRSAGLSGSNYSGLSGTTAVSSGEDLTLIKKQKHELELKLKEEEEEIEDLTSQVQMLEQTKIKLEMSITAIKKEHRVECSQKDEELEETRQNWQKKLKVLEQQLESEHEERINFVKHKHDLEAKIMDLQEMTSSRNCDDDLISKLRKDLRRTKALLKDAQAIIERSKTESSNKVVMRQLRNQLEDAEFAKTASVKVRQNLELELSDVQQQLDDVLRGKSDTEDRLLRMSREKADLSTQLEESEEELQEVMRKYKSCVAQLSVDQITIQEQVNRISDMEEEKSKLKEQITELLQKIESLEGESVAEVHQSRLELKIKELESKLELEQTTRGRMETQINRLKEAIDKLNSECDLLRSKELSSQELARKLQRQLRDLKEEHANAQQRETDSHSKKHELEKQLEISEAEAILAKNDLKLALKRIEDLQTAITGELDSNSDSDSDGDSDSSDDGLSTYVHSRQIPKIRTTFVRDVFRNRHLEAMAEEPEYKLY